MGERVSESEWTFSVAHAPNVFTPTLPRKDRFAGQRGYGRPKWPSADVPETQSRPVAHRRTINSFEREGDEMREPCNDVSSQPPQNFTPSLLRQD